jgi:hypothetical protein
MSDEEDRLMHQSVVWQKGRKRKKEFLLIS